MDSCHPCHCSPCCTCWCCHHHACCRSFCHCCSFCWAAIIWHWLQNSDCHYGNTVIPPPKTITCQCPSPQTRTLWKTKNTAINAIWGVGFPWTCRSTSQVHLQVHHTVGPLTQPWPASYTQPCCRSHLWSLSHLRSREGSISSPSHCHSSHHCLPQQCGPQGISTHSTLLKIDFQIKFELVFDITFWLWFLIMFV